jgi:enediyne polyketide synthase
VAPKIQGARNVLAAIGPEQLRLFIAFGSIIARTGLPGEADYASERMADEFDGGISSHAPALSLSCG